MTCLSSTRRIAAAALLCLPLLLAGCGGAAGDAEAPPPAAALPDLGGRVSNGSSATDLLSLQVTVKGNVGTARTAATRLAAIDGRDYLASLNQLSGPYLLSDSAGSPSSLSLYSVATGPGIANLTPLTTLLVAELLGTDPGPYFTALGGRGGFTAADDAAIAAAEQRVRRYLEREFGFTVPDSLGSFVTTPFERSAGDPMFDTLTALVARIGTNGDFGSVVQAIAQESARCKAERVGVAGSDGSDDFCTFSKSSVADPDDAAVQVLTFANRHGDSLVLRLRGAAVVDLTLTTAEGPASRCGADACNGITIGAPAADGSVAVSFAGTVLAGAAGGRVLSGSARSAVPGIALPGLPCSDNRFYLIDETARRADGYCSAPDGLGLGASGQSVQSGVTRRKFTFGDGAGGPSLELVVQGSAVVSALLYTTDAGTGLPQPQFRCLGAACSGIVLGTATTDDSLGVPVVLQPITLTRAVLPGVGPDGSPAGTSITLEASLVGSWVNDPHALPFAPVACAANAPTVSVVQSEQAAPLAVCEPADTQGFTLRSSSPDGSGNLLLSLSGLASDGQGSFASGNGVTVTIDASGQVLAASFDGFTGVAYRCSGAACAGITVSAPDPMGERSVDFTRATLTEVGTAGLASDRTVALDGSFLALPAP